MNRQKTAEKRTFWIMIILSWFLMTTGFTMLFGPITHLLSVIPGLGGLTKGLLFIVFGIISAIIVFVSYIGIKYWWVILLAVFAVMGYFIYKQVTEDDKKEKEGKKEEELVKEEEK